MTSSMSTVLIIGGSAGIGLAFAERLHAQGKKVIITGRNTSRLNDISKSNEGISTYAFDITDLSSIPHHLDQLFTQHPSIDTIWLNAGGQTPFSLKDLDSTTDAAVINEVTANLTAPILITRHVIPHLLRLRDASKPATLITTSSGLGFVPLGSLFPGYCATKAAVHQWTVGTRQALKGTGVNVIEIVPPYVEGTDLGRGFNPAYAEMLKGMKGLGLDEFTEEIFQQLDGNDGKGLKEVAAGTAKDRAGAWRESVGELMVKMGLD
ncbi:NAD(P)-binding protein, partial [Myriangium duriaei CBS 260.36]